jgi:hypothetical protein
LLPDIGGFGADKFRDARVGCTPDITFGFRENDGL